MENVAVELVVTGRVQGVYFRAALREQADRHGVTGWVSNEPDRSVHAHLEGPAEAVEAVVDWCHQGPPAARVEDVQRRAGELEGATTFAIR